MGEKVYGLVPIEPIEVARFVPADWPAASPAEIAEHMLRHGRVMTLTTADGKTSIVPEPWTR